MIYDLIKQMWQVPMAIVGIRHQIWKTRSNSPRHLTIAKAWVKNGWMTSDGNLTHDGLNLMKCHELLEYQAAVFSDHVNDDLKTKAKTKLKNYDKLRAGLAQYFETELNHLFDQFGLIDKEWFVLDLGAGNGQYLQQFLMDNPGSTGVAVDRVKPPVCTIPFHVADIESESWINDFPYEKFDLVILSEILHCKDHDGQDKIIQDCKKLLKPGGLILINENEPDGWFQWRMDLFANGKALSFRDIDEIARDHGLTDVDHGYIANSHYLSIWKI